MELTRIFNLRQFDPKRQRFRDLALRHSTKPADPSTTPDGRGGISVFETACACQNLDGGDCVCHHIARFYSKVATEPCAYWTFELATLPQRLNLPPGGQVPVVVPVVGDPDECHRNLHHISDDQADKLRRKINNEIHLCVGGHSEPFTVERATALQAQHYPPDE